MPDLRSNVHGSDLRSLIRDYLFSNGLIEGFAVLKLKSSIGSTTNTMGIKSRRLEYFVTTGFNPLFMLANNISAVRHGA